MKIKIINDVYNISNRIKEIDRDYYIVFNTSKNNFEIHNSRQKSNSYCLTLPNSKLDAHTLLFVQKTKVKNIDEVLKNIDIENKLKENEDKRNTTKELTNIIEENDKRR